jgi:outer membrane lipoprotein carrier protein
MRTILASVALVALGAAGPAGQATPAPDDLARKIQAHYDTVKDFQSDFTQVYRGGFSRAQPEQHGKVLVKKPGRMRWIYAAPQRLVIWADGVRMFQYDPAGRAGQESPMPRDADASPSYLFLLDRGNLVRDFTPSLAGDQPAGEWRLTLTPKRPDPEVTSLVLVVDRATLKLRSVVTVDAQGATNTIGFPNLRENVGLSDKDLAYEFPKGTAISR